MASFRPYLAATSTACWMREVKEVMADMLRHVVRQHKRDKSRVSEEKKIRRGVARCMEDMVKNIVRQHEAEQRAKARQQLMEEKKRKKGKRKEKREKEKKEREAFPLCRGTEGLSQG